MSKLTELHLKAEIIEEIVRINKEIEKQLSLLEETHNADSDSMVTSSKNKFIYNRIKNLEESRKFMATNVKRLTSLESYDEEEN